MASFAESHGHAVGEEDFEALYTTYKSDVQRLASYLLKNASDAEDAAQTVFLNVLRALRQGVTPTDPRAWLLAITRNVCFSRHRAAAARPAQVELDLDEPAGPSSEETPSADEIVGALARLLPNQRTALILRDFRGVSRAEICDLMSLSSVAVEALLTRARTAFREELDAGEQQFECAETRALVEQQLDGLITVADRHSLRSHLRHCGACSTLARVVRSSRSKVAGILLWPVDLISRLVSEFTQAPAVVHAAAAVTSAAAVATIAIPAAVSNGPALRHVEGRTALGPVAAMVAARPAAAGAPAPPPAEVAQTVPPMTWHPVSKAPSNARAHARANAHMRAHTRLHTTSPHTARPVHATVHRAPAAPSATAVSSPHAGPTSRTRPATSSGGSVHTPSPTTSPTSAASSPHNSGSGAAMPGTTAPGVSSPAGKPAAKPKPKARPKPKPKKARRGGKSGGKTPRAPAPPAQMPTSTPPAQDLQPSGDGAADAGAGATVGGGSDKSKAGAPAAPDTGSSGAGTGTGTSGSAGSSGSSGSAGAAGGAGNSDDENKDKDKDKHKHK